MSVKDYLDKLRLCGFNIYYMNNYLFVQIQRIASLSSKKKKKEELATFEKVLGIIRIPESDKLYFKRCISEINETI